MDDSDGGGDEPVVLGLHKPAVAPPTKRLKVGHDAGAPSEGDALTSIVNAKVREFMQEMEEMAEMEEMEEMEEGRDGSLERCVRYLLG